jgi:hypothetical protein
VTQRNNKSTKSNPNNRCIGFNVSMPINDFLILDNQAQAEGISRSELVRRAIQLYYQQQQSNKQP